MPKKVIVIGSGPAGYPAALRLKEPHEVFDQGGLAGAVFPDETEDLTVVDAQRYLVQGQFGTETAR